MREVQKLVEICTSRNAFVCYVGKCMHEVQKELRICTSRLTVALMRRIRALTCCNRILTVKVHCFVILEGDVKKWQGLRHISKKKGSQHNCEP